MVYCCHKFDLEILSRELVRAGQPGLRPNHPCIDTQRIEAFVNSHSLVETYHRYVGKPFEGAHRSLADELLLPSVVYAPAVLAVQRVVELRAVAHITGGGLAGNVTRATLRIYPNSGSSIGYTLYSVSDNTWTETGITSSNAPTMGTQLGASGAITTGTWTSVDVTSYITGNGSYGFAFSTTSTTSCTIGKISETTINHTTPNTINPPPRTAPPLAIATSLFMTPV